LKIPIEYVDMNWLC